MKEVLKEIGHQNPNTCYWINKKSLPTNWKLQFSNDFIFRL